MNDKEKFELQLLAYEFLAGRFVQRPDGLYARQPFAPESDREQEARAALVRLLRSDMPINACIRAVLADLFDRGDSLVHERELVFRSRSPGKGPDLVRDRQLARCVFDQVKTGTKVDTAVQEAKERFGVSRATAYRAWMTWREYWTESDVLSSDTAKDSEITVVIAERDDTPLSDQDLRAVSITFSD